MRKWLALATVCGTLAVPTAASAQCYQGCAAVFGFLGGLLTGTVLAQPRTVVVTPPQPVYAAPVYVQPNWGMATSNGCVQQLVGYDQFNRPIMQFVCQ